MILCRTGRTIIRHLTLADAPFIFALFNQPSFLEYIGDKQIANVEQARRYLREGPLHCYQTTGLHMYMVERDDETHSALGLCGLIDRPVLPGVDIGFAFDSNHLGYGYASESALAVIELAKQHFLLDELIALTHPDNIASQRCLEKLGFSFQRTISPLGYAMNSKLFHRAL